ncbi:general secretion pathway protein GspB [Buttiauxella gaviniae]|uniref:general secretion pathway protein GspB n=1 Tax=Buttiauxella gaviniae TaxID=82990 RepID=UPI003BB5E9F6
MNLSLTLKPHSRLSAKGFLILTWCSGLTFAALSGAAACYGWYSLHNPPTVKRVEVPHQATQPWRIISNTLAFNTQPLPAEPESEAESESEAVPEEESPEVKEPGNVVSDEKMANEDTYPGLEQLSEDARRRMPSIKYNAHVYSSETGKSVINLNGNDYHEGAAVGAGVKLMKIEPDDSIFSFEGQTFRVTALSDW